MRQSIIAYKNVSKAQSKNDIIKLIKEAMELANWEKYISGNKIFIKVNLISDKLVPGQCTSPWVLEGVIKTIKDNRPKSEIIVGDTDVATVRQLDRASKIWGVLDICKKYSASFVNLSKDKTIRVPTQNCKIIKEINIPNSIYECDSFITIPVSKTHTVTTMTCALKNQWGCIPRFRHNLHPFVHEVIPEINKAIQPDFVVVDSTISMEGPAPNTGIPKVTNSIFASHDLVATDTCIADFMGIEPNKIKYIKNSEKLRLGIMSYSLKGDKITMHKFKPPILSQTPFAYLEMKLRKVPLVSYLLFRTPLFNISAFIASRYNSVFWYYTKGRKYAKNIVKNYPLYRIEFEKLINNS